MGWNTTLLKKKKQKKKRKRENTTRNRINVASGRVFPAELYFEVLPKILKSPRKRQTTREGTVQGNEQLSMATDATRERRSVRWKNRRTSNWERLFFIFLEKKNNNNKTTHNVDWSSTAKRTRSNWTRRYRVLRYRVFPVSNSGGVIAKEAKTKKKNQRNLMRYETEPSDWSRPSPAR